jgi:CelD/BcsL family acetyltransferase involved in cellulose biosynthesis
MNKPVVAPPSLSPEAPGTWHCQALQRSLGEHAGAWDELNQRLFAGHPMLSGSFVDGLLRHFGDGTEHLCVRRESSGQTHAMCILKRVNAWQWTTFRPAQAQVGSLLLRGGDALQGLLQCLPGLPLALDLLCVDPDYTGQLAGIEPALRLHHALTMSIELSMTFEHYMGTRSGGLRQNLRRYERKAEADGTPFSYRITTATAELADAVVRYAQLEAQGWKGREGTALAPGNTQARFYDQVLQDHAAAGMASVHELWLGPQLAASRLIVRSSSALIMLKTTYDESAAKYAPGRILLRNVIEHAFEHFPAARIEFYTDATKDQLSWATNRRAINNIRIYRNIGTGFALHSLRAFRHVAKSSSQPAKAGSTVNVYEKIQDFPADVTALFDHASQQLGIQASGEWYALLQNHVFQQAGQVAVFVLRHDGVPVAALPMLSPDESHTSIEALSNFYTALFAPPFEPWLKAADLQPLIQAAKARWPKAVTWNFGPMEPDSQEFNLLRTALEEEGLVPFRFFRFGNWSLHCGNLDWATYYGGRASATRNTVVRAGKKFLAQGGRLQIISTPEHLELGILAYERVYASSWKVAEPYPEFLRAVMRHCCAKGWLRLGVAWLGERPIAAQVWLVMPGRAEIFKLAYDQAFQALSPGTLLTTHLMEHAFQKDAVKHIDYLIGDDDYKKGWMDHRTERWGIVAYDARRARGWINMAREILSRLLKPRTATEFVRPTRRET